jgi:hypothetical protein
MLGSTACASAIDANNNKLQITDALINTRHFQFQVLVSCFLLLNSIISYYLLTNHIFAKIEIAH